MPRENINGTDPEIRAEVSWTKGSGVVQVATTNRNHQPPPVLDNGPFDGWYATFGDRESVDRLIDSLERARDQVFGRKVEGLSFEAAMANASTMLINVPKCGEGSLAKAYVDTAMAWMALAERLPTSEQIREQRERAA